MPIFKVTKFLATLSLAAAGLSGTALGAVAEGGDPALAVQGPCVVDPCAPADPDSITGACTTADCGMGSQQDRACGSQGCTEPAQVTSVGACGGMSCEAAAAEGSEGPCGDRACGGADEDSPSGVCGGGACGDPVADELPTDCGEPCFEPNHAVAPGAAQGGDSERGADVSAADQTSDRSPAATFLAVVGVAVLARLAGYAIHARRAGRPAPSARD